ncbi:MAG: putative rane-bound dehydrogenase [Pedosphaera sp.]|nr:putative rane-bound dehydrogenase [Pedosphaera sp.]
MLAFEMNPFGKLSLLGLLLGVGSAFAACAAPGADANRLTYLDLDDPFYVGRNFPRLTTPQWIGELGVDAVVTLAVDDMQDAKKYELFLRPILERLKQIDGREPVSIMTVSVKPEDPQLQTWLKAGLSLEVHTLSHPCPLCAGGNFAAATHNVHGCIDLMNQIPGNHPVAFRMPCCDSMNSASPRFYSEIFNRVTPAGKFLTLDSSVFNIITTNDPAPSSELTIDKDGRERFRKYLVAETNAISKVSMQAYSANIEDYPYPYIIGKLCWEFPGMVPSDWAGFNFQGATNAATLADWKAALDTTVIKQGVFNVVFHPHGWIRNDQVVEFIDYAVSKYGKRVKFLTFKEAQEKIDNVLLAGQPIRSQTNGQDNGVRLMDVNNDGYMDVVVANEQIHKTRIWNPKASVWTELDFPAALVTVDEKGNRHDAGVKFGILKPDGFPTAFYRNETSSGAWHFDGKQWATEENFFKGLEIDGHAVLTMEKGHDRGVRLRDADKIGQCQLIVANVNQNAVFAWSAEEKSWKSAGLMWPKGVAFVDAEGRDLGLRFADINEDGFTDIIFSNEKEYSLHLFINAPKTHLGIDKGWDFTVRSGKRTDAHAIPMIVRGGTNNNNGAWFRSSTLWVQNEDTANLPDKVDRRSFKELLVGEEPPAKSPEESLAAIHVRDGFTVELVASEPLVKDPVAFEWGADGKLWVVEMGDYPLGIDGKGKAGGIVKYLEDTEGDGRYDKATVFLQGLNFPNGVMPWRKGVLVSAAPDIFYAEYTDGDGKADVRKILFTGFTEGNQQHRVNGFEYGLDNRVYVANGGSNGKVKSLLTGRDVKIHGHDLSFLPDDGTYRLEPGQTQFGRHRDDWGNWFGNENPTWLWHYYLPEHYFGRNPYLATPANRRTLANYDERNRVFTIARLQPRFNWADRVYEVTSANSATPYRDDLFGPEFATSVFVSEPANNVVHREVLVDDGVSFTGHRAHGEEQKEFLASTDNWFRPTMAKTGPDGALYIADMYRLVIEHPEYFPEELKHRPDLRAGDDMGRIYRVYPNGAKLRKIPRLDKLDSAGLVAALDSENGWQRDTAQRLLVESKDRSAVAPLIMLLKSNSRAKTRLQALCTLDGLEAITPEILLVALKDAHPAVRANAIRLTEPLLAKSSELAQAVLSLVDDPEIRVRYQLAFSLGEWNAPEAGRALGRLAMKEAKKPDLQSAVMSSAPKHIAAMLEAILASLPQQTPSGELMEQLTVLATTSEDQPALTLALNAAAKTNSNGHASWQLAIMSGFLDGLDRRNVELNKFKVESKDELQQAMTHLDEAFHHMPALAADVQANPAIRQMAIRLLSRNVADETQSLEALGQLLGPQVPSEIEKVAFTALEHSRGARAAEVLIAGWQGYAPGMRAEVINALFSRTEWTQALLTAIENGNITAGEMAMVHRQKLLTHSDQTIRGRAEKLFTVTNSDREKVVKAYQEVLKLKGDAEKGSGLFRANCALCHRLKDEGNAVGPDLSAVSDKPVTELLVSILDPNRAVEVTYASYTAVTRDDRELSGVIGAESPNSITLRMPGGTVETILRKDLKRLTSNKLSLMPEGFEATLKQQDMANLIAYMTTGAHKAGEGETKR